MLERRSSITRRSGQLNFVISISRTIHAKLHVILNVARHTRAPENVARGMIAAIRQRLAATLSILCAFVWLASSTPQAIASAPCAAKMLALRIERRDTFAGMQQDGASRNSKRRYDRLRAACVAQPRDARRTFQGRRQRRSTGQRFMHPGPVVFPIELDAGQIAASKLSWLIGNVFGQAPARSVTAAFLDLAIGGGSVTTPMTATVWGEAGIPITFNMDRFTTALPPLGTPAKAAAGTFLGEGPAESTYVSGHDRPARRLVVRGQAHGTFRFSFEGVGGSAPSTGSIAGPLVVRGNRATFKDAASDCELVVSFYDTQLAVAQTGGCGFGNGVTAAGQYRVDD